MRCMTAIWPAGPPKLRAATRSQVRNASRSDTPWPSSERSCPTTESSAMARLLGGGTGPIVRLRLKTAAPGIERVVHHHPVFEHFVIVGKVRGEPERDREQAAALRGEIVARCIGASHDCREMVEGRILDAVDAHDGIEGAAIAFVGEFDALDVIGRCARRFGNVENVLGGDVDEFRLRIDEAPDQPRTGDAVDFRALARDPLAGGRAYGSVRWQTLCSPASDAVLEIDCVDPGCAEFGC